MIANVRVVRRALPILAAFAAGVGVGVSLNGRNADDDVRADLVAPVASADEVSSAEPVAATDADERGLVGSGVEVVVDDASEPDPEISAAHAARRARRQAAREERAEARREFLSDLNLDLLSARQRETHLLFTEALQTRDSLYKEISGLRAAGKEVPSEIQLRLADAQSVLHADRDAEFQALREAAARSAGLDEAKVRQLMEDLRQIDGVLDTCR